MGAYRALTGSTRYESLGFGTGIGTAVTSGTSNAKGTIVTIGTTTFDYDGFILCVQQATSPGGGFIVIDIFVNTGGSDQLICENLIHGISNNGIIQVDNFPIPVHVPKGATLKARIAQTGFTAVPFNLAINGYQSGTSLTRGFRALLSCTDFNADWHVPNQVTLSGTTLTGWATVRTSTPRRIAGLYVAANIQTAGTAINGRLLYDVGWGAVASEHALIRLLMNSDGTADDLDAVQLLGPFPCDIPASSRIAMRAQVAAANTHSFGIGCWGLVP